MPDYQEGDYVPGRGIMMPDGTYRATKPGDMGDTTGDAVIAKDANKSSGSSKGSGGISPEDMWLHASKTGISSDQFNKLNPTQQAVISALGESAGFLYSSGNTGVTLDEALKAAAKDPNINSKYADALNIDTAEFTSGLSNIQTAISTESENNRMQFEKDRKALAEAHASAGTAYSGFRQQAQKNLETTESGIVTSSRSRAQNSLDQLKQSFASKWGSAATPNASLQFNNPLNSNTSIGGLKTTPGSPDLLTGNTPTLVGSEPISKQNDILTKGNSLYNTGQLPNL